MLHQTLSKGWCGHGSGLLLWSHCMCWWTTGGRPNTLRSRPGSAVRRCLLTRYYHPGHPRPVASLQKRATSGVSPPFPHLRSYFPTLCSQSQFNRRVRALEPELRARGLPSPRTRRAFGRISRPGHHPGGGDGAGEGFCKGLLLQGRQPSGGVRPRPSGSTASRWRWWWILWGVVRLRASPCVLGRKTYRGGRHS